MKPIYSEYLFDLAFIFWFLSLVAYILLLSTESKFAKKWGPRFMLSGFIVASIGLMVRWVEAGYVEVAAWEKAEGAALTGFKWFTVFAGHPPFTNLYESLVFFAWGIVGINLYVEKKHNFYIAGVFSSALALITLGLASMSPGKEITPLVPALQSWWLHFHVFTAAVAYPAFGIAALAAFFYLIKSDIKISSIGLPIASIMFLLSLAATKGGTALVYGMQINYLIPGRRGGEVARAGYAVDLSPIGGGSGDFYLPFNSYPMAYFTALAGLSALMAAILYFFEMKKEQAPKGGVFALSVSSFGFLGAALSYLYTVKTFTPKVFSQAELSEIIKTDLFARFGAESAKLTQYSAIPGVEYSLGMKSNPYMFILLMVSGALLFGYALAEFRRESFNRKLPDMSALDNISYRAVLLGFPLMSLVIITGMIWAHYSWGRYWGWDPKETWSLVTWIWYALYLHTRITQGWRGKRSAVIAVIGLGIVIFTYLGVNLGLTGEGLHSYGKG